MVLAFGAGSADAHHVRYTSIDVTAATVDMTTGVVTYTGMITCTAPVWAFPYGTTGQDLGSSHRTSRASVSSAAVLCPGPGGVAFQAMTDRFNLVTQAHDAWFLPGPVKVGLTAENCPYFDPDDGTSDCLSVSTVAELEIRPARLPVERAGPPKAGLLAPDFSSCGG
jgi:hypothetical protein